MFLQCRTERRRVEPMPPQPSTLTALPKNVPIDWFDPEYWNTLTVKERMDYISDGVRIALPLEEYCKTWAQCDAWKNLPEKEFMHRYGKFVLEKYKLPTKAEMEQLKRWEDGEEEQEVNKGLLNTEEVNSSDEELYA